MDTRSGNARGLRIWASITRWSLAGYLVSAAVLLLGVLIVFIAQRFPGLFVVAGIAAIVAGFCSLITIVALCAWIYCAHANLGKNQVPELHYAPWWAVLSFFVPLLNLFVPFQAMRDLYNRSMGEPAHFSTQSVPDVTSWWTCFLIGSGIQLFMIGTVLVAAMTNIYFTTPPLANVVLGSFGAVLMIMSAFLLHRIVGAITRAQLSSLGVHDAFA